MSQKQANLFLVVITAAWASSYLFTKMSLGTMEPFTIVAYRFILAFVVAYFVLRKKVRHVSKATLAVSCLLGMLLCLVSAVFGYALKMTDASSAGFFISTTVLFVPLLSAFMTRKMPTRQVRIGLVITFIGLATFTLKATFSIDVGMLLCLVTALVYAIHIVLNNALVKKHDGVQLGVYQLGFGGLFAIAFGAMFEPFAYPVDQGNWLTLLALAIFASAFPAVAQSAVQKYTTAEATGFIFALEPIFTAVMAIVFLHEMMDGQEIIGALFVFAGVIIATYTPTKRTAPHIQT